MSRRLFILSSICTEELWFISTGEITSVSSSLQAERNDHPNKSLGCEADVTSARSTEPSIYGPDVEFSIRRHRRRCSVFSSLGVFSCLLFSPQHLTFLKTRQFEGFFLVYSAVNKPVQSNRVPLVVLFLPPSGDNNGVYRFD